eukprot:4600498-Pyramimonas_sp.AAC.1
MKSWETRNHTDGQVKQQPLSITCWTFTDYASPIRSGMLALPITVQKDKLRDPIASLFLKGYCRIFRDAVYGGRQRKQFSR